MAALTEALSDAIGRGVFASRPAAGIAGRLYIATDTSAIYRDNGTTWDLVPAGSSLTIKDEGGALTTDATSLDFVGAGVTASGTGAAKTITIPGATSGITMQEADGSPSGSITTLVVPNDSLSIASSTATLRQVPVGFIGCSISRSTQQSVSNVTFTAITMDVENFDTDGFHSTSSNTSRVTIPAGLGGRYLVTMSAQFAGNNGNENILCLSKNGAGSAGYYLTRFGTSANDPDLCGAMVLDLAAGDYVEMYVYQSQGTNRNVGGHMEVVKLDAGRVGTGVGARVYRSTSQTLTTATPAAIAFDAERFDSDGFHDTSSNTSRLTIPAGLAGRYVIGGAVTLSTSSTSGNRYVGVQKNGTTFLGIQGFDPQGSFTGQFGNVNVVAELVAGDYLELIVRQDSGGNVGTLASDGTTTQYGADFWIARLDSPPGERPENASADSTADVTLTADTIADATGCSFTLAAGRWIITAQMTFSATTSTFDYLLAAITDSSNNVVGESRGLCASNGPVTIPVLAVVNPTTSTTYKLRGQSGRTGNKVLRYSSGTQIGTKFIAVRVRDY